MLSSKPHHCPGTGASLDHHPHFSDEETEKKQFASGPMTMSDRTRLLVPSQPGLRALAFPLPASLECRALDSFLGVLPVGHSESEVAQLTWARPEVRHMGRP